MQPKFSITSPLENGASREPFSEAPFFWFKKLAGRNRHFTAWLGLLLFTAWLGLLLFTVLLFAVLLFTVRARASASIHLYCPVRPAGKIFNFASHIRRHSIPPVHLPGQT